MLGANQNKKNYQSKTWLLSGKEALINAGIEMIGENHIPLKLIMGYYSSPTQHNKWNLSSTEQIHNTIIDFFKFKGPYLQILPLSEFSDDWDTLITEYNLEPMLKDVFPFPKLFSHQVNTIKNVLNKQHVILTASTGRGKTESWLIPIIDRLIKIKKQSPTQRKTRVLLIYPTKALQSDQLNRIVTYLARINERLPKTTAISIAQLDGDTPSNWKSVSPNDYDLHLTCPKKGDYPYCLNCSYPNLIPSKNEEKVSLPVIKPKECTYDHDFSWLKITRTDIIISHPDILIINADLINSQLVNINSYLKDSIINDLEIIVIDEVHLYHGFYGGHVSNLIRRILSYNELNNGRLPQIQFIGASATIGKPDTLFRRLVNLPLSIPLTHVNEKFLNLPTSITNEELRNGLSFLEVIESDPTLDLESFCIQSITKRKLSPLFYLINEYCKEKTRFIDERKWLFNKLPLIAYIIKLLLDHLNNKRLIDEDVLIDLFTQLYQLNPEESKNDSISLDKNKLKRVIDNFIFISQFFNILERRVHVFAWPPNGIYACLSCGTTYSEPIAQCHCGGKVTQIVISRKSNQFYVKGNYCPKCNTFYPSLVADDATNYNDSQEQSKEYCPVCSKDNDLIELVEGYWTPYLYCSECNNTLGLLPSKCPKCEFPITGTSEGLECTNPVNHHSFGLIMNHDYNRTCLGCKKEYLITEIDYNSLDQGNLIIHPGYFCLNCGNFTHDPTLPCPSCKNDKYVTNIVVYTSIEQKIKNKHIIEEDYEYDEDAALDDSVYDEDAALDDSVYDEPTLIDPSKFVVVYFYNNNTGNIPKKALLSNFTSKAFKDGIRKYASLALLKEHGQKNNINLLIEGYKRTPQFTTIAIARNVLYTDMKQKNYAVHELSSHVDTRLLPNMIIFADSYLDIEQLTDRFIDAELHAYIRSAILSSIEKLEEISFFELLNLIYQDFYEGVLPSRYRLLRAKLLRSNLFDTLSERNRILNAIKQNLFPGYSLSFTKGYIDRSKSKRNLVDRGLVNITFDYENYDLNLTPHQAELLLDLIYEKMDPFNITIALQQAKNPRKNINYSYEDFISLDKKRIINIQENDAVQQIARLNYHIFKIKKITSSDPIYYNTNTKKFVPEWEMRLMSIQKKNDLYENHEFLPYYTSLHKKILFTSIDYDNYAFNALKNGNHVMYALPYKGSVSKTIRRTQESYFKKKELNVMISTSSLEVGVDIGVLDLLVLYGTPPSQNSYLQRIGRAGRRSKNSIIVSISKRNPIDALYYKQPELLVLGDPEPIGISETNEFILLSHLVWAIFDYIGGLFILKGWNKNDLTSGNVRYDSFIPKIVTSKARLKTLHSLLNSKLKHLLYENVDNEHRVNAFLPIITILDRNKEMIMQYLINTFKSIRICQTCQNLVPDDQELCHYKKPLSALEIIQEKNLIETAFNVVSLLYVSPNSYLENVKYQKMDLLNQLQSNSLSEREMSTLISELQKINNSINIKEIPYYELLRSISPFFDFSLREFSDFIHVILIKEDGTQEFLTDRGFPMGLREYSPYSITIHGGKRYITIRLEYEKYRVSTQGIVAFCPSCYGIFPQHVTTCPICKEIHTIQKAILKPKYAYVKAVTNNSKLLRHAFISAKSNSMPRESFAKLTTLLATTEDFQSYKNAPLIIENNFGIKAMIQLGKVKVTIVTGHVNVKYRNYIQKQPIILCKEENCNGILKLNPKSSHEIHHLSCLYNTSHTLQNDDVSLLGYTFETDGIFIESEDKTFAHTVAHGIRATIQSIEGIEIRELSEIHVEGKGFLIAEMVPGGLSVLKRLFMQEFNNVRHYGIQKSIKIIMTLAHECTCNTVCPNCFMQTGCALNNSTLDRSIVTKLKLINQEGL